MNISKQYLAGFIDGEGYLGIVRKSHNLCPQGYYYTPVIKITQVTRNEEVLKAIKEFIGYGNLTLDKRNNTTDNSVNKTTIEFRGMKRTFPIAKILYPYLIVKKKQARILMDFYKLPRVKAKHPLNIEAKRTALYEEIRFLNRKGLAETKRREALKAMQ